VAILHDTARPGGHIANSLLASGGDLDIYLFNEFNGEKCSTMVL
jgi:hypothetical protein